MRTSFLAAAILASAAVASAQQTSTKDDTSKSKKPTTISVADSTSILGSTGRSGSEVTPVERTTLVLDISPPFETRLGRPLFRSHGMRFAVGTGQCLAPIGDGGADPATWPLHPWT